MNETAGTKEIRLLKKSKRSIVRAVFSRLGIMFILIVLQLMLLISLFGWFKTEMPFYYILAQSFTFIMALWLFNSAMDPSAKITWLALIALFPLGGALLLLYTRQDLSHRFHKEKLKHLMELSRDKLKLNKDIADEIKSLDPGAGALSTYLSAVGPFPPYRCGHIEYFPSGRDYWEALLNELRKAEKYIFMEYFVIEEGLMWGEILKVLSDKAGQGVDVRLIYDGTCEFSLLPHKYPEMLKALGIKARVFAPLTPFISTYYNYRDHRKICVVDGVTAFTGGVNLADEYIGEKIRFGHWKDAGVMFRGDAAMTFARTFLEMWYTGDEEIDFDRFLSPGSADECGNGYIIPYTDDPLDDNKISEMVYMDILNRAASYVYIMTPYLILDGEMETALKFAAERGVDVRLILPGIPDKRAPYALAWTHYRTLLESGARIYHYTPGFLHSKVWVADDTEAVVGSINLDYRSLYHHFECAAYVLNAAQIADIKNDFLGTLTSCSELNYDTIKKTKLTMKLAGYLMKTVAPLI